MGEPPVEADSDGVRPGVRRTGRVHFDAIVSITAIFISAVSLFVAIEHGKTERELVAANVWPFPRAILSNGYDDKGSIAIGVSNGGVGPAKIRSFELFYQNHPVRSGLDLLRQCCGLKQSAPDVRSELPTGIRYSVVDETVLRPGEDNAVFLLSPSTVAPDVPKRLSKALNKVSFKVCYCSVLDQCWSSDLRSTHTHRVGQCSAPQYRYEPNGQ